MSIANLRQEYHQQICQKIIRINPAKGSFPNFADGDSKSSKANAWGVVNRIGCPTSHEKISGQTAGTRFEQLTKDFLEKAFGLLEHLRPGKWYYTTEQTAISGFDQYEHLAHLENVVAKDKELRAMLGGNYIVTPDIVVGRYPISDEEINKHKNIISSDEIYSNLTPLRQKNYKQERKILHASISCKWTTRNDRAQNTRTEALNLIRNRKGPLPHVVVVTAEPLPTRISAFALGTGDLDCVYHFALPELKAAMEENHNQDQLEMLTMMIEGRRLRDISDLPFDLAT